MALWEMGLQIAKRLWGGKCTTKGYQFYFANGNSRKKKMLRQVFATSAQYQYFT